MNHNKKRYLSLRLRMVCRLFLAALITLMGFTSCSKTLFGKRDKADDASTDIPEGKGSADGTIDPTRPPLDKPIRVLYGVPPRSFLWGR